MLWLTNSNVQRSENTKDPCKTQLERHWDFNLHPGQSDESGASKASLYNLITQCMQIQPKMLHLQLQLQISPAKYNLQLSICMAKFTGFSKFYVVHWTCSPWPDLELNVHQQAYSIGHCCV